MDTVIIVKLDPYCPRCDARMVLRQNSNDGSYFLGCSRYPDCRGTQSLPQGDQERIERRGIAVGTLVATEDEAEKPPGTWKPKRIPRRGFYLEDWRERMEELIVNRLVDTEDTFTGKDLHHYVCTELKWPKGLWREHTLKVLRRLNELGIVDRISSQKWKAL